MPVPCSPGQLLHDTDTALCILRARCLLVRLIHSLHTPAVAAAGGARGVLNLTRLLAAQDLAKGMVPTSVWSSHGADHEAPLGEGGVGMMGRRGKNHTVDASKGAGNTELVDMLGARPAQDSLLEVSTAEQRSWQDGFARGPLPLVWPLA